MKHFFLKAIVGDDFLNNLNPKNAQNMIALQAEGVEKEYNQAILIDLKNNSTFTRTVKVDFPPDTVSDSQRVEFSLIGLYKCI